MSSDARMGYVALAGRPNVGKSPLLNRLLGLKLGITSRKPQTTRHRLLGIKTVEHAQIVYVDTPGIHLGAKNALNRYMNRTATSTFEGVDSVVFLVEALRWSDEDQYVLQRLRRLREIPLVLAVNKVDKVKQRAELLPFIEQISAQAEFQDVFPLSAKTGANVEALESCLLQLLPPGEPLFPEDQYTDRSERFLVAELVREKLIRLLGEEVPYRLAVEIEQFTYEEPQTPKQRGLYHIGAVIWVERPGQKAIVIGKQGEMLKNIGSQARRDIEVLLGGKVFLQLWVKVKSGWSDNDKALRQLGYTED